MYLSGWSCSDVVVVVVDAVCPNVIPGLSCWMARISPDTVHWVNTQ